MFVYNQNKTKLYPTGGKDENQYEDELLKEIYEYGMEVGLFGDRPFFRPSPYTKKLIEISGEPFDRIKKQVYSFVDPKTIKVYNDFDVKHFLGILLYGPPGTGKTCFMEWLVKDLVTRYNATAVRVNEIKQIETIVTLARKSPDKTIIIMLEELDKLLNNVSHWIQQDFQLLCDGYKTPDNVIIIATTNHFNDISTAITQRPSRFAVKESIDFVPAEILSVLIDEMTPESYKSGSEINFPELSFKLSDEKIKIDQVKHVLLNIYAHGYSIEDAIEKVKKTVVTEEEE